MFDLSLVELLFIGVVALLVIGPQDLPKVAAAIFKAFRQLQEALSEMRSQVEDFAKDSGLQETQDEIKTIIDQHGEVQEVYDISEFLDENGKVKLSGKDQGDEQ